MRRTIGARLQKSAQEAPHIYLEARVDAGAILTLQKQANAMLTDNSKVNLTAVLARVTAWTLGRHPALNAHFLGDSVRLFDEPHLGIAVALDDGLIVPVVHAAG